MMIYLKSHDDINLDHNTMNMEEYSSATRKSEVKLCTEHSQETIVQGCSVCYAALCLECDAVKDGCADGESNLPTSTHYIMYVHTFENIKLAFYATRIFSHFEKNSLLLSLVNHFDPFLANFPHVNTHAKEMQTCCSTLHIFTEF